jgi:hypothetical protein
MVVLFRRHPFREGWAWFDGEMGRRKGIYAVVVGNNKFNIFETDFEGRWIAKRKEK